MRRSVFCVCPPGNTQDSARVWRAITFGCIPVTFFRAFDLPFQRHMGMPYADFVLNIQPDDYRHLNTRIQALLDNPTQLRRMQARLVTIYPALTPFGFLALYLPVQCSGLGGPGTIVLQMCRM